MSSSALPGGELKFQVPGVWLTTTKITNFDCLTEKIHVLDKLRSCMTDSAVDCEFNTNELVMHFK